MKEAPIVYGLKHRPGIRLVRGSGAFCWDDAGRKYLDLTCGYGPIILGHAHPEVIASVTERLSRGHLFSWSSPEHEQLAEALCHRFSGADSCLLVKTGSEAVAAAIRVARAATGRPVTIRCGFHGWHDPLISPHVKWHEYHLVHERGEQVRGINPSSTADWRVWSGVRLEDLAALLDADRENVACLLLDPVQLPEPIKENLTAVRQMVRDAGALLILDEVKTGFRVHRAGVQGLYGVSADLTVVSKAIANGFPIAAVVGSREWLSCADSTRIKGTYNGELASVAAALKTLEILDRENASATLERLGAEFLARLNRAAERTGAALQAVPFKWACMPHVHFTSTGAQRKEIAHRFGELMAERGVMMLDSHMNYISLAMSVADLEFAAQAAEESFSLL